MKTMGITKKDLDKLPDHTISFPKNREVGMKYKMSSSYKGRLDWFVGEYLSDGTAILKLALIVDEVYQGE